MPLVYISSFILGGSLTKYLSKFQPEQKKKRQKKEKRRILHSSTNRKIQTGLSIMKERGKPEMSKCKKRFQSYEN